MSPYFINDRDRKLPGVASSSGSRPDDVFFPSNTLDITVLTCYLHKFFHYNMNTDRGKRSIIYEDCVTKGEDISKVVQMNSW